MTHICICNLTIIGSDNGLSPGQRQAIIWNNAGILLIGPSGTNISGILIKIHTFPFKKKVLCKLAAILSWPQCVKYDKENYTGMVKINTDTNTNNNSESITPVRISSSRYINPLRPRQNGRHFPDDIFRCIFMNENVRILVNISLKFVPKGLINNIPALVQIMAWRQPGDKPLSEPMMVNLLTHICVTRPQWVNMKGAKNVKFFVYCWPKVLAMIIV